MGNRLSSLLKHTTTLESKTDREKINLLFELCEALDPSHIKRNQMRSQIVLNNEVTMNVLINLCNAEENPVEVIVYVIYVLARLTFEDTNARMLVKMYPQVVTVLTKLQLNADKTIEINVLGLLRNMVFNLENAGELATTLAPLLLDKLESDSEEVQLRALVVWKSLANVKINAWELLLGLVPLFDDAFNSEQIQVEALKVLGNLMVENQLEMADNHATLVPLLISRMESSSDRVQLEALNVLRGLLYGNDQVGDIILVEHVVLMPVLLHQTESSVKVIQTGASHVLAALAH